MKHHIFIIIALLALSLAVRAEGYPIKVVNGQRVYVYTVQKSEGLWRISRNFGVTQDEILKLNPELETTGLRYGETIYIPIKDDNAEEEYNDTDSQPQKQEVKGIKHKVKRKETLYSLAKQYGVSVDDIVNANPDLRKSKLKSGSVIIIPEGKDSDTDNQESESAQNLPSETTAVTRTVHIISQGETLYSLGKKYGVTVEELQAANPIVSKNMPVGAELIIPGTKPLDNTDEQIPDTSTPSATKPVLSSKQQIDDLIGNLFNPQAFEQEQDSVSGPTPADSAVVATPLRIAFILPFCVDAVSETSNDRFIEFYQGALLAIKHLQDKKRTFEIYTFDSDKGDTKIDQILGSPDLLYVNAIIGPAYPSQVAKAAKFAKENQIPLIVPFTSKVPDVENNPYILQFNPTDKLTRQTMIDYLVQREYTSKCLFVSTPYTENDNDSEYIEKELKNRKINTGHISSQTIDNDSISNYLDPSKENIVFFDFENVNALQSYISRLNKVAKSYRITLFAHHTWAKQKSIKIPMIYTNIFDINSWTLLGYSPDYLHYFKHNPQTGNPRYDLLGYDLTNYTVQLLEQDNENSFKQRAIQTDFEGIQSKIKCIPVDNGGCINNHIQIMTTN